MRNIIIETCEQRLTVRRYFCDVCWFANVRDPVELQDELERMGQEGLIKQIDRMPGGGDCWLCSQLVAAMNMLMLH